MRDHAIYGGCLRSDVPLPELPVIECTSPDWTFHRAVAPLGPAQFLGEERVADDIRVRCSRLTDGIRLEYDDTGTFDISRRGADIAWTPGTTTAMELVRTDLLGGVLSVALHLQGLLVLHGSAVGIGDTAVGFLANKGTGKSTLATALCAAGATLITDDTLPVEPSATPTAWPAMPAVRLLHDSASHLRHAKGTTHPETNKYHVNELPRDQVEMRRLPLSAIYELSPVQDAPGTPAAERTRVTGTAAVATLLRHNRAGGTVGTADSMTVFLRASDIVRSVPVYRLHVARGFDRLQEAVARIRSWHVATDAGVDASRAARATS